MTRRISDCLKISSLICDAIIYKNRLNNLLSRSFFEANNFKLTTLPVLRVAAVSEMLRNVSTHSYLTFMTEAHVLPYFENK